MFGFSFDVEVGPRVAHSAPGALSWARIVAMLTCLVFPNFCPSPV